MAGFTKAITSPQVDYDAAGRRTKVTHPDGQAFSYTYDARDRLTGIYEGACCAAQLDGFAYNAEGNLYWRSETGGNSTFYSWDGIGRLLGQSEAFAGGTGNVQWTFNLNHASQIVSETRDNDAYAYNGLISLTRNYAVNGLNQYTTAGPASFTYDLNGNLTADGSATGSFTRRRTMIAFLGATSLIQRRSAPTGGSASSGRTFSSGSPTRDATASGCSTGRSCFTGCCSDVALATRSRPTSRTASCGPFSGTIPLRLRFVRETSIQRSEPSASRLSPRDRAWRSLGILRRAPAPSASITPRSGSAASESMRAPSGKPMAPMREAYSDRRSASDSARSPSRRIPRPRRTSRQSIVNGHVLRENQWHYWSVGSAGWVSAETFMLIDASFLKAALALEDWHGGSVLVRDTPYDVNKVQFFDTTDLDRTSTIWHFHDPDRTPAAKASRMVNDFAAAKGFRGGRLTGHHIGEKVGVVCLPLSHTTFAEVPVNDIDRTPFPFGDINDAHWAQVGRAAAEIAAKRGVGAGFFTGHLGSGSKGWFGLDASLVEIFDVDDLMVAQNQWAFTDINTVGWAQAARVATDICIQRGFAGGFFTGHQLPNRRQIAALRYT
jgi:YD repeat-containing protein